MAYLGFVKIADIIKATTHFTQFYPSYDNTREKMFLDFHVVIYFEVVQNSVSNYV